MLQQLTQMENEKFNQNHKTNLFLLGKQNNFNLNLFFHIAKMQIKELMT